jgi:hypothetical protein
VLEFSAKATYDSLSDTVWITARVSNQRNGDAMYSIGQADEWMSSLGLKISDQDFTKNIQITYERAGSDGGAFIRKSASYDNK